MEEKKLAGCVILDGVGRVLLLHRKGPDAQWELPGGKVEAGESPEETAKREILEELGIKIHIVRELGGGEFGKNGNRYKTTWFEAEPLEGEPFVREPHKFDNLKYFFWSDLRANTADLSPNTRDLLTAYATGKLPLFPGLRVYCRKPEDYHPA